MTTFGRLFKGIALPIVAVISMTLLTACGSPFQDYDEEAIDENFSFLIVLNEYVLETDNLLSVSSTLALSKNSFVGDPVGHQKNRYNVIQELLAKYNIKSVSVERESVSTEFNINDSGVFGDYYLSVVYSENPERSTILNTPEVWRCKAYDSNKWYICKGSVGK